MAGEGIALLDAGEGLVRSEVPSFHGLLQRARSRSVVEDSSHKGDDGCDGGGVLHLQSLPGLRMENYRMDQGYRW